jgi:hypothetical protein
MKPVKGYYSIIQFCPDHSRLEAANVGVVLLCPEHHFLETKLSSDNGRIQRFFGKQTFDWARVNSYKQAIKERLQVEGKEFRGPEDLEAFALRRANSIQLTTPRPMPVSQPRQDLERLYEEVVGDCKRPRASRGFKRQLISRLNNAGLERKLKRDIAITIPSLNKQIEVPFGYKNERFNLIQPVSFQSAELSQLNRTASVHAIDGIALYQNPDPELGALRLVVVGNFRTNRQDAREQVERILEQGQVRLFTSAEVNVLIDEIRRRGRELSSTSAH